MSSFERFVVEAFILVILNMLILSVFCTPDAFALDGRINRCLKHKAVVEAILADELVSKDYFWLMVAESGCREDALSSKGAKGYWQLMKSTALTYNCENRSDLVCSTRAAARYIRHLSRRFKTFDDVIKAYNMGGHNYARYGSTKEADGLVYMVTKLRSEYREQNLEI